MGFAMREKQFVLWGVLIAALVALFGASLWRGAGGRLLGDTRARVGVVGGDQSGGTTDLAVYGQVPDFALMSQAGDTVRLANLRGRVWVGDFIFTHCASSCPMMSAQLQKMRAALGADTPVQLVSFSVDPERDTPERLAEYARGYNATPDRWLFLTGDKAQVRHLALDGFHLTVDDPTPEELKQGAEAVMHSTRLALVDREGRIRGYYDGTDEKAMRQLGTDVRRLLANQAL
jgi:cytochrome oxidase Cu insertion factor (SCO1/SenC/PrrC family)